jgi:hypothetical protein
MIENKQIINTFNRCERLNVKTSIILDESGYMATTCGLNYILTTTILVKMEKV